MNYRQLQIEMGSLRTQGLVRQDLKLNASQKVLAEVYQNYLNQKEKEQILNNPLLVIWLIAMSLAVTVILICLALILIIIIVRNILKINKYMTTKLFDNYKVIKLRNKLLVTINIQKILINCTFKSLHKLKFLI